MFRKWQEVEVERKSVVQVKVHMKNDPSQTRQGEEISTPPA